MPCERGGGVMAGSVQSAAALPGERVLRGDLIDQAVREINRIYVLKGLEAAKGIGEYLLRTFFHDDPEEFRTKGRKHLSFRRLAERPDLRVSYMHLWRCVSVLDQLKALPAELADALPVTHHVLLLPVHDERLKVLLARKAVRQNLSKHDLRAEIRRLRPLVAAANGTGTPRGRPPVPPVVRLVWLWGRVAKEAGKGEAAAGPAFERVPREKLDAVLADAEKHLATMRAFVDRLRRQLGKARLGPGHGVG